MHKPGGMTSHDVVSRVRKLIKTKHVGHGGTLDPMADGVLPIGVGSACRLFRYLPSNKIYKAEVLLGTRTTTDDIEGEPLELQLNGELPTRDELHLALSSFIGEQDQLPPMYSAIHHEGKRLYELARQGVTAVPVASRKVVISSIELLDYVAPRAVLRVTCGGGTYIRSIARDLGETLGCGGCLSALRREQSGSFKIEQAFTLEQIAQRVADGTLAECFVNPADALGASPDFVTFDVTHEVGVRISMGQKVELDTIAGASNNIGSKDILSRLSTGAMSFASNETATDAGGGKRLLLVCEDWLFAVCTISDGKVQPEVVLKQ